MKRLNYVLLLLALVFAIGGCGKEEPVEMPPVEEEAVAVTPESEAPEVNIDTAPEKTDQAPQVAPEPEEPEIDLTGLALNPLTGLYIDEALVDRRPIGVMINNHHQAIPQSGIAQADIIYETLVEGGIARLFALFKDFDAEKIGPVRSARHYYLDFAFDFDALYVHYGQSPQADVAIKNLNAPNMNGLSYLDTIMCFQDPARKRPHSTYTSYDGLMRAWDSKDYRLTYNEGFVDKFRFADQVPALEKGGDARKITLDFSKYQYAWFDYDSESMKYMRNQFGGPQIDVETGEQLAFDNVIVQIADMWVIKGDSAGRMDMTLVGEGKGFYISHGKSIPITWSKTSHYDPTVYLTEEGSVLQMLPGKTWIAVFPSSRPEGLIIE